VVGQVHPYVETARLIGSHLVRSAVWHDRICNWFSPVSEPDGANQMAYGTLGPGLYDGTAGIALFLGRLHLATSDTVFGRTAAAAIGHALARADDVPDAIQLGLYTGRFGIGYAAIEVGRCLANASLIERGVELIRQSGEIDPRGKAAIDVMSGNAGVIPLLLRLHAQLGEPWLLDLARARGEALLARASRSARGRSWDVLGEMASTMDLSTISDGLANITPDDPMRPNLIGYSHGAGGIAWSLLELGAAIDEPRFMEAARDGFAYEDSWFDTARDHWPDLRQATTGNDVTLGGPIAWCHGAVGIGLARMRAWELTGDARYRRDAVSALRLAGRSILAALAGGPSYSLCHGVAGDAELLITWWELTGDREARQLVDLIAQRGMTDYAEPRKPWPSGLEGKLECPGLMLGLAGTGYFYLRAADALHTPSVLLVGPESLPCQRR